MRAVPASPTLTEMRSGALVRAVALAGLAAVIGPLVVAVAPAQAGGSNPFVVRLHGDKRVRVQIAEGTSLPCDASGNRPVTERWIAPGEEIRGSIGGDCLCFRQTFANFPNANWSTPQLACVPRRCRRSACRPLPDPTIRVHLASSDGAP